MKPAGDRPCPEWYDAPCVIAARRELGQSALCEWLEVCMYSAPRDWFTGELREVLDAWSNSQVCLLIYAPTRLSLRRIPHPPLARPEGGGG